MDEVKSAASTAPQQPKPAPAATPVATEGGGDTAATAAAESNTGPRSPVVTFAADFDYTWPSRAVTAYKKGYIGRVKAEVAKAAAEKGALAGEVNSK